MSGGALGQETVRGEPVEERRGRSGEIGPTPPLADSICPILRLRRKVANTGDVRHYVDGGESRVWVVALGVAVIGITAAKAIGLGDGFSMLEPDEQAYTAVAKNFHLNWFPTYLGRDFYSQQPLFMYVIYLFSFLFPQGNLAGRVVALLASAVLAAMVFWYGRKAFSPAAGFAAALLTMLMPLSVFYSRRGLIDFFITCLVFAFFVLLRGAIVNQGRGWASLAGVLLALIVLSKLQFLVLFAIPVFHHLHSAWGVWRGQGRAGASPWGSLVSLRGVPAQAMGTTVTVLILAWIPLFVHNPLRFGYAIYHETVEFLTTRRETSEAAGMVGASMVKHLLYFLGNLDAWLGWPVVALLVVGLAMAIARRKLGRLDIAAYFLVLLFLTLIPYPFPRYLVAMVPAVALLAGLGCAEIAGWMERGLGAFGSAGRVALVLVVAAGMLPSALFAYRAGNENLLAELQVYLSSLPQVDRETTWLYSPYWPVVLYYETGYRSTWLTDDMRDARAWEGLYPIEKEPMSVLRNEGGIVVVENLHSRMLGGLESREGPLRYLRDGFSANRVLQTEQPAFPYTRDEVNTLEVYVVEPGKWRYDVAGR